MILLVDNYDSFSYNLYQMIGSLNPDITVIKNDQMNISEIKNLSPSHIVISPGPGYPYDAGVCIDICKVIGPHIPVLGVCLGHQAICQAFGGTISHAKELVHGKQATIKIDINSEIFKDMPSEIKAARYHTLALMKNTIPEDLKIIASASDDEIMAVEHKDYQIYGVQFHPESILTPNGMSIIKNFLEIQGGKDVKNSN